MAKKMVKQAIHKESWAAKDTFWNRERVKRGITYSKISERYEKPVATVCGWFIGKVMPRDEAIIGDLCKWFSDTPYTDGSDCIITYECGIHEFEEAHKDYSAKKNGKTIDIRSEPKTDVVEFEKNITDTIATQQVYSVRFLLRQRHITYKQLASNLKCTVTMIRRWVDGYDMPNDVYIDKMADILEYDPDKLTELFRNSYDREHNVDNQIDINTMIKEGLDNDVQTVSPDAEVVSNDPDLEIAFSPILEDTLKKMADHHDDHERFVNWFNLLASISPVRITEEEIVNIMAQYVCCDYNMFMALEAWHNECKTNYVHERYILLTCERNKWLGEDHEI